MKSASSAYVRQSRRDVAGWTGFACPRGRRIHDTRIWRDASGWNPGAAPFDCDRVRDPHYSQPQFEPRGSPAQRRARAHGLRTLTSAASKDALGGVHRWRSGSPRSAWIPSPRAGESGPIGRPSGALNGGSNRALRPDGRRHLGPTRWWPGEQNPRRDRSAARPAGEPARARSPGGIAPPEQRRDTDRTTFHSRRRANADDRAKTNTRNSLVAAARQRSERPR